MKKIQKKWCYYRVARILPMVSFFIFKRKIEKIILKIKKIDLVNTISKKDNGSRIKFVPKVKVNFFPLPLLHIQRYIYF
jgi:hypothetical protein